MRAAVSLNPQQFLCNHIQNIHNTHTHTQRITCMHNHTQLISQYFFPCLCSVSLSLNIEKCRAPTHACARTHTRRRRHRKKVCTHICAHFCNEITTATCLGVQPMSSPIWASCLHNPPSRHVTRKMPAVVTPVCTLP